MRRFNSLPIPALTWLLFWFGAALLVHALPESYRDPILSRSLQSPLIGHWMGFDPFGKDLQISVLHASLKSAVFASFSVALSVVIGLTAGALIAMAPARPRFIALRMLDTLLAFPSLLLALALAAIRGPGWETLLASLLIGVLPSFIRLIYARSREILSEPYIEAAQSLGANSVRILFHHLFPMLRSVCAVKIPFLFSQALMAEATLSFLGVGAPIGQETWGSLLSAGKEYLFEAPHIAFSAGIPLTLTLLALQSLSDASTNTTSRSSAS
jgi:peptide/nickel transport system permease protein